MLPQLRINFNQFLFDDRINLIQLNKNKTPVQNFKPKNTFDKIGLY